MAEQYVIAIDQGTTSTRAMIFDHSGNPKATGQKEHEQIYPKPGWVEHNPKEIWDNAQEVVKQALSQANLTRDDIGCVDLDGGIVHRMDGSVRWR